MVSHGTMASGPQLGDEVRVVRGRGVRRDLWAVLVLGVGVIVNSAFWDLVPPNVAMRLSLKRSKSAGAT